MLKTLLKLGGATIKRNKIVNYKTGYQVAIDSNEIIVNDVREALTIIKGLTSCGVWLDDGKVYIDSNTKRIASKKEAIEIAKKNNQIAIWDWKKRKSIMI